MQFCMHYAFETEARARMMLENVTRWLRPGGMFIATIPNSEILLGDLYALPEETEPPFVTGNEYYRVTFDERPVERPTYGFKYKFWLLDAVDNVPEYVVHWDAFEACVGDCGGETDSTGSRASTASRSSARRSSTTSSRPSRRIRPRSSCCTRWASSTVRASAFWCSADACRAGSQRDGRGHVGGDECLRRVVVLSLKLADLYLAIAFKKDH